MHLGNGHAADRQRYADPIEAGLLLRMDPDMGKPVYGRPRGQSLDRHPHELPAKLLLHSGEEFVDAPAVEHIFEPSFGAVGAIAVVDVDPHHRVGHERCLGWLHDHAGRAGEILVTRNAADA